MGISPLKDQVQTFVPQFEYDCLGHRTQVGTQWGHGIRTLGCQKVHMTGQTDSGPNPQVINLDQGTDPLTQVYLSED